MNIVCKGIKINYEVIGEGEQILLLHGWAGNLDSLRKLAQHLADDGFQCVLLDLPGFGKSEKPKKSLSLDDFAGIIEEFVKKKDIRNITIFGHSFGGSIAVKLVIRGNVGIKKLVLCNCAGIREPQSIKLSFWKKLSEISKKIFSPPLLNRLYSPLRKFFYYYILRERDYIDHPEIADTFKKIIKEDLTDDFLKVNIPTLILWGMLDQATPLKHARIMCERIDDCNLIIVKNAGHDLPKKKPDIVVKKMMDFLKS